MKKKLGSKFSGVKIGPKTMFFYHFLKFSLLVFLEITYSGSLQQHLTCSRGKVHEKKFGDPNLGLILCFFCYFLRFGLLIFFEIAYSDNTLQQCLTTSRSKIHEKKFSIQIWVKLVKIGSKIKFFCHFF